ncbi:peptidase inhibitor family I36 protein [Streptomyces justiciae]|uniref:peptidase inhibitor family I36 protein n=1 Tax=Streptomyces justiciae TaxID=2780140 RepID=UPI00187ED5EA|nr:peptidase inhibitor family I36 protein [Streptomyces justiciae]MBE8474357.1 peptidase inhibitor family I36 protein [Streptomyces justiciae]
MLTRVRARTATLFAGALLACAAAGGAPAHAAWNEDCSAGALCVYPQRGFAGEPVEIFTSLPPGYVIDDVGSIINNSTCAVRIYEGSYSGDYAVIPARYRIPVVPSSYPDKIAAVQWIDCS